MKVLKVKPSLKTKPDLKDEPVSAEKRILKGKRVMKEKQVSQGLKKRGRKKKVDQFVPKHDYRKKYLHLLDVKNDSKETIKTDKDYIFVPIPIKVDTRPIILKILKNLNAPKQKTMNQKDPNRQG